MIPLVENPVIIKRDWPPGAVFVDLSGKNFKLFWTIREGFCGDSSCTRVERRWLFKDGELTSLVVINRTQWEFDSISDALRQQTPRGEIYEATDDLYWVCRQTSLYSLDEWKSVFGTASIYRRVSSCTHLREHCRECWDMRVLKSSPAFIRGPYEWQNKNWKAATAIHMVVTETFGSPLPPSRLAQHIRRLLLSKITDYDSPDPSPWSFQIFPICY